MFDRERTDEDEEEQPARSILGLGRIEPSPFRLPPPSSNGEAPTRSLLGLEGLTAAPLRRPENSSQDSSAAPTSSLLGLQGIRPAPIVLKPRPEGIDAEPPNPSILGLGAIGPSSLPAVRRAARSKAPPPPPELRSASFFGLGGAAPEGSDRLYGEPHSRSFFGLEGLPYGSPLARATPRRLGETEGIEVPEFERDVEHRAEPAFPVERAVLASVAAHVLILLLLLSVPAATHDPSKGLLAAFVPPPKTDEDKVPIIFREAPGPERANPKKSDLSDADRRAGGGDRSKPAAKSPFVAEQRGKQGLLPGPRQPAGSPPAGTAVAQAPAGKGAQSKSAGEGKTAEPSPPAEEALKLPDATGGAASENPGGRTAASLQGLDRAIRDAARGVGAPGEQGSGFPNPDGGFVDSGPLSFDTTWYDWGPYAAEMIRRIKLHWDVPELARFGWKGKVTVRFFILGDGRVEGATILSHSGVPPFDYAAFQAVVTSSPFRPLPKDLGSEREGVTVTFFYNMRPGDTGSGSAN